nr:DUF4203 domain-containing protein [uncultured Blautia sp.]
MTGILQQIMNTMEQTRTASVLDSVSMIGFAALLVLGVINCVLGYRLLRFWMMLFGFLIGGGIGLGVAYTMGIQEKYMYAMIMVGVGILVAVIAFLSYKIGIFIIGAGIGLGLGIYVFHPTTSLVFFFCLLLGAGLGVLAMKWARVVLIVGTSLLGGAMAGFSLAKLGGLADIPYGLGLSVGCALLGMLIQFATNRRTVIEEEEVDPQEYEKARRSSDYMDTDDYLPRRKRERENVEEQKPQRNRKKREEHSREHNSTQQKRVVDVSLEKKKTRKRRLDDPAPEQEATVIYRPKRTSMSAETARNSSSNVNNRNVDNRNSRRDVYEDDYYDDGYDDYYDDEPIDEEDLDEQIIQEMMAEDDREGEKIWNKISRKNSRNTRNTKNTKRNRNAR